MVQFSQWNLTTLDTEQSTAMSTFVAVAHFAMRRIPSTRFLAPPIGAIVASPSMMSAMAQTMDTPTMGVGVPHAAMRAPLPLPVAVRASLLVLRTDST